MTELHLFRHGQTQWNLERRLQGHKNSDLTDLGKQQAIDARQKLQGYAFDVVYSSPSGRAKDTAKLLTAELNLPINEDAGLKELNVGPWEGMVHDEILEHYATEHEQYHSSPADFKLEGAETFSQLMTRAQSTLLKIIEAHQDKRIIVVSHGLFVKAAMTVIQQRPIDTFWDGPQATNLSRSIIHADKNLRMSVALYCDEVWPIP